MTDDDRADRLRRPPPGPVADDDWWQQADRIGTAIVKLLEAEIKAAPDEVCGMPILAGPMLALLTILEAAPANAPRSILAVRQAVEACLGSMYGAGQILALHGWRPGTAH